MRPLNTKVVLKQASGETMRNGIYLPTAAQEKVWLVHLVGPDVTLVSVGHKVLATAKGKGATFTLDGESFVVMDEADIEVIE